MSNCSTPTCQIDGRIRPVAPAGAAMSTSSPGNPSGGCVGRGRSSNRSGRHTGAFVTQGFLAGIAPTPAAPPPPSMPATPAQPPPASFAPLPVRQPPGSALVTPARPPADMPVPIATGVGYPVAPTFVQGVPVGAVMTIPRTVGVAPTTISGVGVPASLADAGKGAVAPQPPAAPPLSLGDAGKGAVAPQPPSLASAATLGTGARAAQLGGASTAPLPPIGGGLAPVESFQIDPKVLLAMAPRPAGAPQAFDPEGCASAFAALPLLDQARVFEDGRLGAYAFAQAVARDLRRGFAASGTAGVAWLFRTFARQSHEVRDFCAAVSASSVAPAGAAFAPPSAKAAPAFAAPYIAPKALPSGPVPQRADDVHACLDALHAVPPLAFGRSMPFARANYSRADGSVGFADLLDNSYSAGVWRALSNPATPYADGVSLRDGYIAGLRRSVASADADAAYRDRSLGLRAVIRQLCAVLFPDRYGVFTDVLPAGEVDMDFSNDPSVPGSNADPWAGLRGGGLGPAVDNSTGVRFDPATGQPMRQPADSTAAVVGGIGQVAQQGFGVLGAYLTGEAQRDAARYAADAQRAAATATAQSAAEVARINADRDLRIAELTAQMRVAQQSGADASTTAALAQQITSLQAQIAAQPQPQQPAVERQPAGLSTGAMVGLGAAGVAAVGGIVYLATRRKSNGASRRRRAA